MMRRTIILLMLVILSASCKERKPHELSRGFYFWKTNVALSAYEQSRLKEAQCRFLYIRMFDVDWDDAGRKPQPLAIARFSKTLDTGTAYVPVVFITAKTLRRLKDSSATDSSATDSLAVHLESLLAQQCRLAGIHPDEVQIDCDWTAGTKSVYFRLLRGLSALPFLKGKKRSCTIRLHQVKDAVKTGVPPVDKGLLMCYNMGDIRRYGPENSILEIPTLKAYLKNLDHYSLPLDIALPLFSWCLLFEQHSFKGILRDVPPAAIRTDTALFKRTNDLLYICIKDTDWNGYYLHRGAEIRVEEVPAETIVEAASFASGRICNRAMRVLLYHADSLTLSNYTAHELEAIYKACL